MKCAHHFTNERAPVADHAPCSWSAEVWLVHRLVWMALWINKETKLTTLAPPTKLTSNKRLRWTIERVCMLRIEDRALPICFVQDKHTVSPSFHLLKRLCYGPWQKYAKEMVNISETASSFPSHSDAIMTFLRIIDKLQMKIKICGSFMANFIHTVYVLNKIPKNKRPICLGL